MAMLAEPRRKQRWSVDPRNSAWSKDDSKFGQKMLEKMGWSKGKGLGAQEQGNTEHVRVQVKNNTLGLGASANHGDNWIAHQDDFNQLLAELNDCHGQDTPEAAPKEEKKTFSLEEKSKTSRKRVHYMKFAKGKDLSNRSEEDLTCIFGKRPINNRQVNGAKAATIEGTPSEEEEEEEEKLPEQADAGNTVTSTLTVQEYFAKRMAKLKKARPRAERGPATPPSRTDEASVCSEPPAKKKKSHKHTKTENESESELVVPEILGSSGGDVGDLEARRKKKKGKKRKKSKRTSVDHSQSYHESPKSAQEKDVVYSGASDAEDDDAGASRPKKKDVKKHNKRYRDVAEGVQGPKSKKNKCPS